MASISISNLAYSKILLHASKYPDKALNGVLLENISNANNENSLSISDAIPLCHINIGLCLTMEIALTQVDSYCSNHKKRIVGYYHANEHLNDSSPNSIAFRVVETIQTRVSSACLLMLNNETIGTKENALDYYFKVEGKWKLDNTKMKIEEDSIKKTNELIKSRQYRKLSDFDNSIDDITCDWKNVSLNKLIVSA